MILRCTIDCYHIYKFGGGLGKCTRLTFGIFVCVCFNRTAEMFLNGGSGGKTALSYPSGTAERAPAVKLTTSTVSLTVATRGAEGYYDVALPSPPFDGGRDALGIDWLGFVGSVLRSYGNLLVLVKVHCTQSSTIRTCHHHLCPG